MTDQNSNNSENKEIFIEEQNFQIMPERHGCVTAWLVFMIVANSILALYYLFTSDKLAQALHTSTIAIGCLIVLGILNVVCSIMLLRWKILGFYGFIVTTVFAFILNLNIGISPISCFIGLLGFAILYGILQIKQNGVTAWSNLK